MSELRYRLDNTRESGNEKHGWITGLFHRYLLTQLRISMK